MRLNALTVLAAAAIGTIGVAQASPLVVFGYNNLEGGYAAINANSGQFTARAVDQGVGGLQTDGSVDRNVPGAG